MQHNARTIIQYALATTADGEEACAMDAANAPGVFSVALDGIRAARRAALAAPAVFRLRALLRDCALDGSCACDADLFAAAVPALDATGIVHPANPASYLAKQLQDHYQRYHHGKPVKNCKYAEKVAKTAREIGLTPSFVLAQSEERGPNARTKEDMRFDGEVSLLMTPDRSALKHTTDQLRNEIANISLADKNRLKELDKEWAPRRYPYDSISKSTTLPKDLIEDFFNRYSFLHQLNTDVARLRREGKNDQADKDEKSAIDDARKKFEKLPNDQFMELYSFLYDIRKHPDAEYMYQAFADIREERMRPQREEIEKKIKSESEPKIKELEDKIEEARLGYCRKAIPDGEATSLCEIAKMAEEEIKAKDPNPVAKEWIEKAPETIKDDKARAVATVIREEVKKTEEVFNHGLEEMAGQEEIEAAMKKAEEISAVHKAENAVQKAEKAYDRAKESFRKVIENGLEKGDFTHNEKGALIPSSQKALDRYRKAKQKADDALTALNAAKDALANPKPAEEPKPVEEPKPTEEPPPKDEPKPAEPDTPAPEKTTRLTMEDVQKSMGEQPTQPQPASRPAPSPLLPDALDDYDPPPGAKLGAEEKAQISDVQAQYKAAMSAGDTAKAIEARDRYRQLCADLDHAAEQMGCGRTLPQYTQPHGEPLSEYIQETLQGLRDQFDMCVKSGDKDQACRIRDQHKAFCAKLNTMFEGKQKDSTHAERGALSAMWDAIGDAIVKIMNSTLGKMFGFQSQRTGKPANGERTWEDLSEDERNERARSVVRARSRAIIDSLIKNGQIKSSPSGTSSGGGDTIGLDRLTAGSFTGPDTPPPTSIYPEVPPDQRDTSFMDEKKKILEDLFKEAGVHVRFDNSLNGPSTVSYEISWEDSNAWKTKIKDVLDNTSAIGSEVSYALNPNGEPKTARLYITNPTPRDAYVSEMLKKTDMDAIKGMGIPYLVGDENGSPKWVDISENAFIGGDSGSGKSVRMMSGLLSSCHVMSPNELQIIGNFHSNPGDAEDLKGLPHLVRIGKNVDQVLENLRCAITEIERRERLFADCGPNGKALKNLKKYNELVTSQGHPEKRLPYQLNITDEVTSLIEKCPEAGKLISHIVREGRKFGIIFYGATQNMSAKNLMGGTDMKQVGVKIGVYSGVPESAKKVLGINSKEMGRIKKKGDCVIRIEGSDQVVRLRGSYAREEDWKALRDYDANAYHRVDAPPKAA